jgi:hypothetical protein
MTRNLIHKLHERQLTGRPLQTFDNEVQTELRRIFRINKELMGGARRNQVLKKVKIELKPKPRETVNHYANRIFTEYKKRTNSIMFRIRELRI